VDISLCCLHLVSEWQHDFGVSCLPQLLCKTLHSLILTRQEKLSAGTSLQLFSFAHTAFILCYASCVENCVAYHSPHINACCYIYDDID